MVRLISIIGLVFSLAWFFKGIWIYRKYRAVADTPLTTIRGMAMGLVQISGKAVGEQTLLSPISRLPCFLYKVNIERWMRDGGWSPHRTDAAWVSFYVEDETGRVAVQARGAELDLEQTGQREVSKRPALLTMDTWETEERPVNEPGCFVSEDELRHYVARVESGMRTGHFQEAEASTPGSVESQQSKPSRFTTPWQTLALSFLGRGGQLATGYTHSIGDYRLTEYCVQPEYLYDITGTCAENPGATNEFDHKVVAQGRNAGIYLISNRTEKQLAGYLRGRALRYSFGGGLLAIGFLGALLQSLGIL